MTDKKKKQVTSVASPTFFLEKNKNKIGALYF